ncbi:MAG: hypothetical protein JWN60_2669 [Acidobacteria bacterium]|nr:hypothetical protein [Acidobacteriota bacterium]
MKKFTLFFGLFFLFSASAAAQVKTDFSGAWTYNKIISLPDDKLRTETITMIISQTASEIKIQRGSEGTYSYPFGNETAKNDSGANGKSPVKLKAELTGKGKLNLNSQQIVNINNENITVKIEESFELSSDGNTIKVEREVRNSKGLPSIEAFIATKQHEENSQNKTDNSVQDFTNLKNQTTKSTLNGKAKHLEMPSSPNLGRRLGIIPVRVIFDETGRVVFAQTFFGHSSAKSLAVKAAMKTVFEPLELNGKHIKVSGTILYEF